MISVSKKVVAIVAAAIAVLLVINIVLVVNAGGGSETSGSNTVETSLSPTVTDAATPSEETTTSSTMSSVEESTSTTSVSPESTETTAASTTTSTNPSIKVKKAPSTTTTTTAKSLTKVAILQAALAKTKKTGGFVYTSDMTIGDTDIEGSGAIDLVANKSNLWATVGQTTTEFRRIGSTYYVNAQRLGSTSTAWVQLDGAAQSAGAATKSVRSFVENLTPARLLEALNKTTRLADAGVDAFGRHYQATVGQSALRFVPLVDVIDQSVDSGTSMIDVWVDSNGQVNRLATTTSTSTMIFTLDGTIARSDIATPSAGDVGGVTSTSGSFVFGTEPAAATAAAHDITASPTTSFVDGVIRGKLNATSATGDTLRFDSLGGGLGGKLDVGTVPTSATATDPQSFTVLPFATWLEKGGSRGTESFDVRIREVTATGRFLNGIALIGQVAKPIVDMLQDTSDTATRVAASIGVAETVKIDVKVDALAPGTTDLAFTTFVTSFDDTKISVNFFPHLGTWYRYDHQLNEFTTQVVYEAPTVLESAGLGLPGQTNPYAVYETVKYVPGPSALRNEKYNVITWDPRGSYASEGTLQLNNFFFERRDVSAIITWASGLPIVLKNGTNDPAVGMVGDFSGGTIQLLTAGAEPRIDAIIPTNSWNSLVSVLQPGKIANVAAAASMFASLTSPNIRLSEELKADFTYAIANGSFTAAALARLSASNGGATLAQLQAPTLFLQSTTDSLTSIDQSLSSVKSIDENPYGVPAKVIWFDGTKSDAKTVERVIGYTMDWLDGYVNPDQQERRYRRVPRFEWQDQRGEWDDSGGGDSGPLPYEDRFRRAEPVTGRSDGGSMTISDTSISSGKVDVAITVPADARAVGAPSLRFSYTGTGSTKAVFARVVDVATGSSLTPTFTPVPVVLDGRARSIDISLQNIVYTAAGGAGSLRLEIRTSADGFKYSGAGQLAISDVVVDVPLAALKPV